jgi:hypothetical protein
MSVPLLNLRWVPDCREGWKRIKTCLDSNIHPPSKHDLGAKPDWWDALAGRDTLSEGDSVKQNEMRFLLTRKSRK